MTRNTGTLESRELSGKEQDVRRRIGSRIAALREEREWSQAELARRIGVGRTRLGKWETGEHVPHVTYLLALKATFGVSLDELVEGRAEAASPVSEGERVGLEKAVEILSQLLRRGASSFSGVEQGPAVAQFGSPPPPGHECPRYEGNEKPPEGGSLALLEPGSPGFFAS